MKVRALLGKKVGMTQVFTADGTVIPVSVIKAGPCVVLEKKSSQGNDRYSAIKIGFEPIKEKSLTKPELGFFKKLDQKPLRHVREIRIDEGQLADFEVGQELGAAIFEPGDVLTVSGRSKGRGFSGVMKRFGFGGARATHGTHKSYRSTGSVGCSAWPGRIWKGKKMPGQHGNTVETTQNIEIVKVDAESNLIMVRGAIPGHRNSLIFLRNSKKKWKRG